MYSSKFVRLFYRQSFTLYGSQARSIQLAILFPVIAGKLSFPHSYYSYAYRKVVYISETYPGIGILSSYSYVYLDSSSSKLSFPHRYIAMHRKVVYISDTYPCNKIAKMGSYLQLAKCMCQLSTPCIRLHMLHRIVYSIATGYVYLVQLATVEKLSKQDLYKKLELEIGLKYRNRNKK